MDATRVITILIAILYVLFWIAVIVGIVYLFILIVKALKNISIPKKYEKKRKPLPNLWARL